MAQSDPNRVINHIYQRMIPIANSTEKQENVKLVLDSMRRLVDLMKLEDALFACLYQETAYSGSYWDGLRVKEATEFDLNIVLKLPCQVQTAFSLTQPRSLRISEIKRVPITDGQGGSPLEWT